MELLTHQLHGPHNQHGLGWKEPLEVIQSNEQGHLQEDHVPQGPVEADLESSQEWGIYSSLGNLCQCYTTFILKKLLSHLV